MILRNSKRNMSLWLFTVTMAIIIAVAGFSTTVSAFGKAPHWVGTWSSSPEPIGTYPDAAQSFDNQTVRQIVHTSIGGYRVRVRLSNAFGTQPLEIGAAHIAISDAGAAIKPETDRALTFSGLPSITIPPGALVLSDPAWLKVRRLGNLAVSIFLPSDTGPATTHATALQTNYISSEGDFTASPDAAPFVETTTFGYFLTGVEVKTFLGDAVVAFGDSITDGYLSTVNTNNRWPNELARRLQDRRCYMGVLNAGISGNRILHDHFVPYPSMPDFLAIYGPNGLSRFDRDVLSQTGVSHVIVLEGINDIRMSAFDPSTAVTADEIIAGLQQLIARAKVRGLKVIGGTLTPFEGASDYTPEGEEERQAVNDWIRTSEAFDGIIDFDEAVRDPDQPTRLLPDYDSGDHLHLNDAGYQAMANAVDLRLLCRGSHYWYMYR